MVCRFGARGKVCPNPRDPPTRCSPQIVLCQQESNSLELCVTIDDVILKIPAEIDF